MKKLLLFLLLAGVAAVLVWGVLRKSDPPKVGFVRVKRQTLVSTLPTNGKVEPSEWQAVRAETGGIVSRAPVQDGQAVAAGAVMAAITDPSLQADIDAAAGQTERGAGQPRRRRRPAASPPTSPTSITAWRARSSTWRRRRRSTAACSGWWRSTRPRSRKPMRRAIRCSRANWKSPDCRSASGRWCRPPKSRRPARAWAMPRRRSTWRGSARRSRWCASPIAGVVYGREVRQGSYVNAGDLIANVGRMDRLRVRRLRGRTGAGPRRRRTARHHHVGRAARAAVARAGGQEAGGRAGAGIAAGG